MIEAITGGRRGDLRCAAFVLFAAWLVHATGVADAAGGKPKQQAAQKAEQKADKGKGAAAVVIGHDVSKLPPAVADMRSAILAAVESGDMADLKTAIELNEMKPEFGAPPGSDAIAFLKQMSGDGEGREMLAILGRMLEAGWASIPGGRDIENNRIYVWPYFAEVPLDKLKPGEEVALYKLVTPAEAKAMKAAGKWTWWRLSIGADGVWHVFAKP